MVNISKRPLSTESIKKIYSLLYEIIGQKRSEALFLELISDILSPTEKIMIAKRIYIIYLLIKKVPQPEIAKALKVSVATVSRYALFIERGELQIKDVIIKLLRKEKVVYLLDGIFSELFIRPGLYKNHWSLYMEYQKRKSKRQTSGI